MIKNRFGKTQYYVSKIALGTVQFGLDYGFSKKKDQYEVDSILECALRNGINLIDTAREYGDSEKKIGDYTSRHSHDFIIATKLKKLSESDVNCSLLKDKILKSIGESLINLKLQSLDILQLHQTDAFLINKEIFWDTIRDLKTEGSIGAFGVSVYSIEETIELVEKYGDTIDFFQVPYNIFDRRFEGIKELLNKHSVSIVSRSTFLKGIIPCDISILPSELEELKPYKKRLQMDAKNLNMSTSELAMLFAYCSNYLESTLLGVNSSVELENNLKVIKEYSCTALEDIDLSQYLIEKDFLVDPRKWTSF